MATQVDLRQLRVDRTREQAPRLVRPNNWTTRYGIPFGLVLAFGAVVAWSARASFLPAKEVTIVPVVLARAEVQQAGAPLFQAAGWIEPRPTPTLVSAVIEGILEKLLVVEGQEVQEGEPVAQLIDSDARLALEEAAATMSLREAELVSASATLAAAKKYVESPVHLESVLAEAEAAQAKLTTELKNLPFVLRAAVARATLAEQELDRKKSLGNAIAGRMVQQAQSEFDSANASVEELKQRGPSLEKEEAAWKRRCDALGKQLDLKTDEHRKVAESQANVEACTARLEQARINVKTAQLRLERMTLRAPIRGRVLALYAQPGRRLMGLNAASERDASTVVGLYDPRKLQARADVRLEDVPHVQPGQPVQITTAAFPTPLSGRVITATSQADIQKNTLQVKVAIDDPPSVVKPEMLVQVTFLAPEREAEPSEAEKQTLRVMVPRELLRDAEGGTAIWVVDPSTSTARLKQVKVGRGATGSLVEIESGLSPLDKLIVGGRESVKDGERILVTGEDRSLGSNHNGETGTSKSPAGVSQPPAKN
jgi:HlyD family secretion protein